LRLGVAACRGGDKTSGVASLGDRVTATTNAGGSQAERQAALNWARCMRQHGINNLPDPQITAQGIDQQDPPRMSRNDPQAHGGGAGLPPVRQPAAGQARRPTKRWGGK
jgi:hypothetical protein